MARPPRPSRSRQLSALGAALQAMRKQKGLSQEALAKRTGGLQSHISAIEKGTINPCASTLIALASALGAEWVLIPKGQAAEARRLAGLSRKPDTPDRILGEVYVPEPEEQDDAG
jgi:transcriptional regulator with XRE-family HTH domain